METILMSRKERKRLEAFGRVKAGDLTLVAASGLLGLSYRQAKRAWSRYQSQGDAGLVHRLRGRASNRQSQDQVKQQALALYRQQYADYGPTLAAECLAQEGGMFGPGRPSGGSGVDAPAMAVAGRPVGTAAKAAAASSPSAAS